MARVQGLRIATRASALAMWQSEHVAARLRAAHPGLEVDLVPITTEGDRILDRPLAAIGGKGLFIKELEVAMAEGRADLAVHSMKDVPAEMPDGFALVAILAREDPRDMLVSASAGGLDGLPRGARVGTSSLRRQSQLLWRRPDLVIDSLRGNVPTRLKRLRDGEFAAIVLAAAGLRRLELVDDACTALAVADMLPAVGQGAIGIECRAGDADVSALCAVLDDPDTACRVRAERAMNARLGGSCHVPVAGHACLDGDRLSLDGLVAGVDGRDLIRQTATGPAAEAERIGRDLAESLLAAGAARILAQLNDT
ncbi:MAG: hydroxymethylbilane synthase [Gammaproteobacteria bacterium]|nr:hydroxymethylbilane synthase [Gammaproteobacteria bacterium]